ncbi:aspartyl protease family protein [Caulobacter segnis]|uniref:aspartyl protease family protein n=1 Tax=Caulobacter segnis TaxID=88688 RepID=UPI0028678848|nr:aspartyl protease family protein [Caulobacter segnis]MDR6626933.1 putative aspartyl protease [Caulobacter segnis]
MASKPLSRRVLVGALASAGLAPGADAARSQAADEQDRLRYLDAAGRLSVKALVNGEGPFDFLIDTGATASVIASEITDRLGLRRTSTGRLHSIAGAESVAMTHVASLAVGKRLRRDMTVAVLPRALLLIDGVLGLDWLGKASLLLDFGRQRMVVGQPLPIPDAQTAIVESRLIRSGLTLIDARIPRERIIAFIDTGSTTTAGNLALMEAAIRGGSLLGAAGDAELRGVTGQVMHGRAATLTRLTLGEMTLRNAPLIVGPIHTFDYWGLNDRPAIVIGVDILRAFDTVAIDFKRNEVRFRVPDGSSSLRERR